MRRYLPAFLLSLATLGPTSAVLVGCDLVAKMKGDSADAGVTTSPVVVGADAAVAAAATTETPPPPTAVPTMGTVAPTPTVPTRPVGADAGAPVVVDAGATKIDAGATKIDAGVVPVPTFNIPNLFDAGAFKGFDAGGLKLPTFPK